MIPPGVTRDAMREEEGDVTNSFKEWSLNYDARVQAYREERKRNGVKP